MSSWNELTVIIIVHPPLPAKKKKTPFTPALFCRRLSTKYLRGLCSPLNQRFCKLLQYRKVMYWISHNDIGWHQTGRSKLIRSVYLESSLVFGSFSVSSVLMYSQSYHWREPKFVRIRESEFNILSDVAAKVPYWKSQGKYSKGKISMCKPGLTNGMFLFELM